MTTNPSLAPAMVHVPAGSFLMGTSDRQVDRLAQHIDAAKEWRDKGYFGREQPQHTLTLPDYYIGTFPVTVGEYRLFVAADGYLQRRYWTASGWEWRDAGGITQPDLWDAETWTDDDRLPVVGVSWYEAYAYCQWLSAETGGGYCLPTEAEWEKAARGTDGPLYPWGNVFNAARCNTRASELHRTTPVGQYSPEGDSPYGCADMVGNVSEWTVSRFRAYPYRTEDGREDPTGESERAIRGGSWFSPLLRARRRARDERSVFQGQRRRLALCLLPLKGCFMSKPNLASSDLSSDTQRWVADAVGAATKLESIHPLAGATSSTLHSITARFNGREIKLVLRRFTNTEWLEEEPGLARHEAASLKLAGQAATPTPELIAYDETGESCGVPAILMTQLPGSVELKPRDFDRWLHQLAEVLLPIHSLRVGTFPWHYQAYNDVSTLQTPTWSTVPELWERTIEIVNGPRPETRECFIHRDYHPTNVLWQADQVSGIVDWPNACRGAANIDVAWCRANLASLYGVTAADRFLQAYESLAGPTFDYHPYWDLIVAIEGLPGPPGVYPPWVEYGVRHLTAEMMRERQDEYLTSIFARI